MESDDPQHQHLVVPPPLVPYSPQLDGALHDRLVEYAIGWIAHNHQQPKSVRMDMLRKLLNEFELELARMEHISLSSATIRYRMQELQY